MDAQERGAYVQQAIDTVRTVDVLSIFFPTAMRALILDLRSGDNSDPQITVDRVVTSAAARSMAIKRRRPDLPRPQRVTIIPWPGYVMQLDDTGVLAAILERCGEEGGETLMEEARSCYRILVRVERDLRREIVFGSGMQTVWQRGKP